MVLNCVCRSVFQDERYGPGRRYHNQKVTPPGVTRVYRCTVCARENSKEDKSSKKK